MLERFATPYWKQIKDMYNNVWLTMNNNALIISDAVMGQNQCWIVSWVTIYSKPYIVLFHLCYCMLWINMSMTKMNINNSFNHCCQGQGILNWYCDITWAWGTRTVESFSPIVPTQAILVQSWYAPRNIIHIYQSPIICYSSQNPNGLDRTVMDISAKFQNN